VLLERPSVSAAVAGGAPVGVEGHGRHASWTEKVGAAVVRVRSSLTLELGGDTGAERTAREECDGWVKRDGRNNENNE
jgi:hypothetical protein